MMSPEGQLFAELRKCDDDAAMEEVEGTPGVYRVTTSLPLHAMDIEGINVQVTEADAEATQPENIFATPIDNVSLLMAKYLFMALAMCSFCSLLFSLPLYMWSVPHSALVVLQVLGGVGMVLGFGAMCVLHGRVQHWFVAAACSLGCWLCSLTLMLGAAAGLSHSLGPYQLLIIWWVQYVALSIYLQWIGQGAARDVSFLHAVLCMGLATLVVWGISIATFVHDGDWVLSIILLAQGFTSLLYTAYQMQNSIDSGRYAKTRVDMLSAMIDYHVDVPAKLLDLCRSQ